MLNVTKAAKPLQLSLEATAGQEALLQTMKTVRLGYTENSQNLHEMQKPRGDEDLGEIIGLLLCDPPHNVRRQQDLQIGNHDGFNANAVEVFCDILCCV